MWSAGQSQLTSNKVELVAPSASAQQQLDYAMWIIQMGKMFDRLHNLSEGHMDGWMTPRQM